jgi:hypothetical protein
MANLDAPYGFCPVRGEYNAAPRLETFTVASSVTVYQGMPVCLNTTGQIVAYTDALALAGAVIGVAAHPVTSAATTRNLQVYSDPNQVFEIQADDNSLTQVADYLGGLFDIVNPTSGNTTLMHSIAELDASSFSTVVSVKTSAASLRPLRVEGVSKAVNNEQNISYTKYLVRFAPPVHHRGLGQLGIGSATVFKGIG